MATKLRLAVVGPGAFGVKHLEGLAGIPDAEVAVLVGQPLEQARAVADRFAVPEVTDDLSAVLARRDIDAVILATPTPLHAAQAIACLKAGKHVEVEIPMADNLADAEE